MSRWTFVGGKITREPRRDNMIEDAWNDFPDEKKTDIEWDCPEHWIPKVPKQYKIKILKHKQNEPIEVVEKITGNNT
jgi:hypothetical protein